MSNASERARALLDAATQGRWEWWGRLEFPPEGNALAPANAALVGEACQPAGGLLATLAAEVERLEKHERDCAGVHASPVFVDKTGTLLETIAENARLRKALDGAKIKGHGLGQADESIRICGSEGPCICGAYAHNARIDAALRGERP